MCRNIKTLYNFAPPASPIEIQAAALQYVRKVSGYHTPSHVNEAAFAEAIEAVGAATQKLLDNLVTNAPPHDRAVEARKAHQRAVARFGAQRKSD